MKVKAWEEKIVIPTYGIGAPEKNPMFLEKRVYQGSSGVVYPHPVIEKIHDEKFDKEWLAVFLENQYLKIMILPELGGRVQMAYDKTRQRHFVYYNQVIKPALVGLTGPWISGGIEFNWPQHHRPSTYEPVDHRIEEHADGSVTVWCSEVERMFRTRGMAGFTLYPDKAYLEIKVQLFNRTDYPQTFLWWANPAVKVNDEYQSVFPPDVNAVFDHGKRDVSEFPIARGTYYKVDYAPGTDISWYKNIPVPTSYMVFKSKYDFVGGYEHDTKSGVLHVANHHISPGKKQWTWGHGDFGQAWDRNLTDEDGPYVELMCGVFTDNQPDFSWLMPGEEKSFSQYFMPYRDLGLVKNATIDAMVNLETINGVTTVKGYTTADFPNARITLECKKSAKMLLNESFDFHPSTSYEKDVVLPGNCDQDNLVLRIASADGITLVSWSSKKDEEYPVPEAAKAAKAPGEIQSNEQLYLTGLHLEQYRHATRDPRDYYFEALKRDPHDSRCNNALGLWYLRRGDFSVAENYFRQAIKTITERNPNPPDGASYYNLGLTLRFLNKDEEAYDCFYKAVWNSAWQDCGYFQLARLATCKHSYANALELIEKAMDRNRHHHKARHLKVALLRRLGKIQDALSFAEESLAMDAFNYGVLFEKHLIEPNTSQNLLTLKSLIRKNIHNYIEFSLDYAQAGLFIEASEFINVGITEYSENAAYPLAYYFKSWYLEMSGRKDASMAALNQAMLACPDYCFPNQPEAVKVLSWALGKHSADYKALYYLGNFWYNAKNYKAAIDCWRRSVLLFDGFPTPHRNLALALYNKANDSDAALKHLEKAFDLEPSDARILMELDQLYKRLNYSHETRLQFLDKHPEHVEARDDLYLERVTLLNFLGRYEKAYELLLARKFHPWEGGEGKVTGQYVCCLTEMAKGKIDAGSYDRAIDLLNKARFYPNNLGEGKLHGAQENDIYYWLGVAYSAQNDHVMAKACFSTASQGIDEPSDAVFYNDKKPDMIYYQGLALLKLNDEARARLRFIKLIEYGKAHLHDQSHIDYFAVSLPDLLIWNEDLSRRNQTHCYYLMGLGYLGLNENKKAVQFLNKAKALNNNHQGVNIHLRMINSTLSV
jgi:tetratricopeptide (TPR) repeat protein